MGCVWDVVGCLLLSYKLFVRTICQTVTSSLSQIAQVGPRFAMNPIKIFSASFGGQTLYENPFYVSPNAVMITFFRFIFILRCEVIGPSKVVTIISLLHGTKYVRLTKEYNYCSLTDTFSYF